MKILIVSQYFWPEDFRVNDIALGLKESGHEVEILTGIPNYPQGKVFDGFSIFKKEYKAYKGMRVYRTLMLPRRNGSINLALNYISFMIMATFRIIPLMFKKYDRVFVFQISPITSAIPAILISKIKRIPSYVYIQDLWPETFYSIVNISNLKLRKFMKAFCIKVYNSFSNILIASEGYRDILNKDGIEDKKIEYFPQWAEDFYLNNLCIKDRSNEFIVTFAGNIGKAQNVETIIKAAELIEKRTLPIIFNIIGDGSDFVNIKNQVKKLNLKKINLLGRKPSSEMPKYFSESDGLIVTLNDEEILKVTLPANVQSYMASGKPILGAISGEGNKIIKESNCGLVVDSKDYEGLAENIIKLYNMSVHERKILGENGKEYFNNNFTRKKLLDKLNKIIR